MAPKTERDDSAADWQDVVDELNKIRLTNDWSYRELTDDIKRVSGFEVSGQTLQPLLAVPRAERSKPYDRTIFKIRQYLDLSKAAAR